jgi:hypothetical protein
LLYKQQVKNGHIICLTNSRCKTVTLFAVHTAGENMSHYLLYKQQVKNVTLFALQTAGEKL